MTSLDRFCAWLEQSSLSQSLQSIAWVVPAVQTVHILAVATVLGSALLLNLRFLGLAGLDQPLARACARFLPAIWWALPVLMLTGAVLITGEPARSLKNPIFQLKMSLLIAALALTGLLQLGLARGGAGETAAPRGAAILIALPSLVLWGAIVCAGRWIAYF
jgi:hypothetical protein